MLGMFLFLNRLTPGFSVHLTTGSFMSGPYKQDKPQHKDTNKMLRVIGITFFLMVGMFGHNAIAAEVQEPSKARMEAALRYIKVASMQDMTDSITKEMAKQVPEKHRGEFILLMKKSMKVDVLEKMVLKVMVRHFNTKELNALAEFYGSTEGKSILVKFGPYMAEIMPLVQQEVMHAVEEMKKERQGKK